MIYRPDIDGLRTLAISSILLFHLGFSTLSGGYIGVDVFFVISGFLITTIILTDLQKQTFSFSEFYTKRIYRLFPALFGMVIFSLVAGYVIFMPDEFKEFAQSVIATSVYISNIFFWLKSDYFAGPSELKPLLHTWSLAVEEQFYFVFPAVLFLIFSKLRSYLLVIVLSLILISFTASIFVLKESASTAFYLSPFRFWELLIGSLIAILQFQGRLKTINYPQLISITGLAMIFTSIFLLDKATSFPGFWALLPVIGTSFLIIAGPNDGLIYKILQSSPFVYIGKLSYSLYLWHWPIVVYYGYWIMRPFTLIDTIVMFSLTFILSILSYKLLEQPFRKRAKNSSIRKPLAFTVVISALLVITGAYISAENGIPSRFESNFSSNEKYEDERDKNEGCFLQAAQAFDSYDANKCTITSKHSNETIALWGDSHANHLISGFKHKGSELPFNLLYFANAGCPPILDVNVKNRPNCKNNNQQFANYLTETKVKTVILAASWYYADQESGVDLAKLKNTINYLNARNIDVVIANQLPIYSISNPSYLVSRLESSNSVFTDYSLSPAKGLETADEINNLFADQKIINLSSAFCKTRKTCSIFKDGELMVVDQAHLSRAGSAVAVDYLIGKL